MATRNKCAWCPRNKICYPAYYLPDPPCYKAEDIVDESHCDDKLARYDAELSDKMLLLSAAAYDESNQQLCLRNILPRSEFEQQYVATKDCDPGALFTVTKCSGFVAISHIEKAIVLGFRGSTGEKQASVIASSVLSHPKKSFITGGEVQLYFKTAFNALWQCLESVVKSAISAHPSYKLWVTGHSLGGALASLASAWIVYNRTIPRKNIILYTFGMPRVGNKKYATEHDKLVNNSFRVVNYDDPVTHMPTQKYNVDETNVPYHHGVEVFYSRVANDAKKSPHKECHGKPFNEDQSCSFPVVENLVFDGDLDQHKEYFGVPVGTYWEEQCSGRGRRELSENFKNDTANQVLLWKDQCSKYKYENGSLVYVRPEKSKESARSSCNCPRETIVLITYWPIFIAVYTWST